MSLQELNHDDIPAPLLPLSPSFAPSISRIDSLNSRLQESLAIAHNQLNSRSSSTQPPGDSDSDDHASNVSRKVAPLEVATMAHPIPLSSSHSPGIRGARLHLSPRPVSAYGSLSHDSPSLAPSRDADAAILQLKSDLATLNAKLIQESSLRQQLEHEKLCIELQLEDLSQSLFQEANKMVVDVRRDLSQSQEREVLLEELLQEKAHEVERKVKERDGWKMRWEEEVEARRMEKEMVEQRHKASAAGAAVARTRARSGALLDDSAVNDAALPDDDISPMRVRGASQIYASSPSNLIGPWIDPVSLHFRPTDPAFLEFVEFCGPTALAVGGTTLNSSVAAPSVGASFAGSPPPSPDSYMLPHPSIFSQASAAATLAPIEVNWNAVWACKFSRRVQQEDVDSCLKFAAASWKMSRKLPAACRAGSVFLELVPATPSRAATAPVSKTAKRRSFFFGGTVDVLTDPSVPSSPLPDSVCALCAASTRAAHIPASPPVYQLRFDGEPPPASTDLEQLVCSDCRSRLVVVCEFWAYLRMIKLGLVRRSLVFIWAEVQRRRVGMWAVRNGVRWVSSPDDRRDSGEVEHGWMQVDLAQEADEGT